MYSQNNEEEIILNYFADKEPGHLWDIGAYDGKTFSNTLALLEKGWHGDLIEASPWNFIALIQNTRHVADRCTYFHCAVGTISGIVQFHDSQGDAISTPMESLKGQWPGREWVKFWTPMVTPIPTNPDENMKHYDFINIDIEGGSAKLAIGMLPYYKPSLWCIEHDHKEAELREAFTAAGYSELLHNGENIIFGK